MIVRLALSIMLLASPALANAGSVAMWTQLGR